jgi:hypothetical protein
MLSDVAVSRSCSDCVLTFSSQEVSFHLRRVGEGWAIDTVNERGSRHDDWARFSNLALVEKYLIWIWASAARTVLRKPLLGPELYARGFDPEVHVVPISPGTALFSSHNSIPSIVDAAKFDERNRVVVVVVEAKVVERSRRRVTSLFIQ